MCPKCKESLRILILFFIFRMPIQQDTFRFRALSQWETESTKTQIVYVVYSPNESHNLFWKYERNSE
jgi:hypothetical protein